MTKRPAVYLGVGFASAAVLVLEIVLTRLFAITQFYHFAFVTVGLALLGFGASGSMLAAVPALGRGGARRWSLLAALQAVTTVGAYVVVDYLPFDSYALAWDGWQVLYLVVLYGVLGVPFFFGGAVVGVLLAGWDQQDPIPVNRVYAANLIGSSAGCLLAVLVLPAVGGVGALLTAAGIAILSALAFTYAETGKPPRRRALLIGALAVVTAAIVFPPTFLDVRLSPYKELSAVLRSPEARLISTHWTSGARVDHVRSPSIRSLPGLSYAYAGPVDAQDGLTFDGDDLSPIPLVDRAEVAPHLLAFLPFSLRPGGEMLVLEPRGGLDLLVALAARPGRVTAVEPSRPAVRIAREVGFVYDDPRVHVVDEEPRTFVERTGERFDVVDLALTAPYRPVTSGAYSLAEDYPLTTEAFEAYLRRLKPGGVLSVVRWIQTPPSESVRLVGLAAAALRSAGGVPERSIVALRGYANVLVLVAPDGFDPVDLEAIRRFAERERFDLMAAPGLSAAEANRFNVLPDDPYYRTAAALLSGEAPQTPEGFDLTPPTDDHPFFGHYFTWKQAPDVWASLGATWQPFGGAGYFVLLAFLALSIGAALLLILVPVAVRGREGRKPEAGVRGWAVAYFALLGIGFLFVELPIFQQYILLLGRPTTALAVVLFVLLVSSGIGARLSERIPWRPSAFVLTILVAVSPSALRVLRQMILGNVLSVRILLGAAALVPLGLLMGVMFPHGLARLRVEAPDLVPWAWGINGAASVISSAAAALLSLSFGFATVIGVGAGCYGLCALLARPNPSPG